MEDWFHIICLLVQTIESKKETQRERYRELVQRFVHCEGMSPPVIGVVWFGFVFTYL